MVKIPSMNDEQWMEAVRDAHATRAEFYWQMYRELKDELGREQAIAVMGRACRAIGRRQGERYKAEMGEVSPERFREYFCAHSPLGVALFQITPGPSEDDGAVTISHLNRCALVDGWRKLNVPEAEIADLCKAAREVDHGKLDTLGLEGEFRTLIAEGGDCCAFAVRQAEDVSDD